MELEKEINAILTKWNPIGVPEFIASYTKGTVPFVYFSAKVRIFRNPCKQNHIVFHRIFGSIAINPYLCTQIQFSV